MTSSVSMFAKTALKIARYFRRPVYFAVALSLCFEVLVPAQTPLERPVLLATTSARSPSTGSSGSFAPVVSPDGQSIAFLSQAKNLVFGTRLTPHIDLFIRDLTSGEVKLVSASTNGLGSGDADSGYPSFSSNGQFVVFESAARNLHSSASNGFTQIYLRNVAANTTTLVTVSTNGNGAGNGPSFNALLASDARFVVFESGASNLVDLSVRSGANIYRRDLLTGSNALVSINVQGNQDGILGSKEPSMSSDGRWIAFFSQANDLALNGSNWSGKILLRDMESLNTQCISSGVDNLLRSASDCQAPEISADGRFVVFTASNSFWSGRFVARYDRLAETLTLIGTNADSKCTPGISADGRFVSWETPTNACVWDSILQTNVILTAGWTNNGPVSNALPSMRSVLSPSGNKVTFLAAGTNSIFQLYVRQLPAGTNELLSLNRFGEPGADLTATTPSWDWNGDALAFETPDPDMIANDFNGAPDVFYRNLVSGTNVLISGNARGNSTPSALNIPQVHSLSQDGRYLLFARSDDGGAAFGIQDTNRLIDLFVADLIAGTNLPISLEQNGHSMSGAHPYSAGLSANGRYVVFASDSDALVAGDTNKTEDVFRRDLQLGITELVSANRFGNGAGDGASSAPSVSANGRWIAFQSGARNLNSSNIFVYGTNIYARDMVLGTNHLVSAAPTGNSGGNYDSIQPVVSPDGRWIAVLSRAENLVTNYSYPYGVYQLFVRDMSNQVTHLASRGPTGGPFQINSGNAAFAPGGDLLVFASATNLFVHDLSRNTTVPVCNNCSNPSISRDGVWIVYESRESVPRQIIRKNLYTGQTNLISVNRFGSAGGEQNSSSPVISHDGRYVVFASRASDLVPVDTNGFSDIFVRDLRMNTTFLVSRNLKGVPGNGPSSQPMLGPDGRTVCFQSFASDLAFVDDNENRDLFVFQLSTTDSDGDGMDDDWEVASFGNLERDGKGDFDGDGQSDLSEFQAGTNPANGSSAFHVLSLTWTGGGRSLFWSSVPGRTYRVQYKTSVSESAWMDLGGDVVSTGTTSTKVDNGAGASERFYRVLVLP